MSDREHFIATLQACYFGDKNALEEIVRIYDEKENIIKEAREKIEGVRIYGLRSGKTLIATLLNDILEILDKDIMKKSDYNYEKVEKENKE